MFTKRVLNIFLLFFVIATWLISCEYNPLGGDNSEIDDGNSPFLSTPKLFEITDVLATEQKVSLRWSAADGAKSYKVWYGTSSKNYTNSISGCLAENICEIPGLTNGVKYYFKISAQNIFGTRDSKAEVAATVGPFQSLTALPGDKVVYLTWNPVDIAKEYIISYGVHPGPYTNTISGVTTPYVVVSGLTNGTTYQFIVTAKNAIGSITSNQATATPLTPPFAPTGVTATALSPTSSNVSWVAAVGLGTITYKVSRSLSPGGPFDVVASNLSAGTLSIVDANLLPGMQYYYVVSASNSAGSSPNSIAASVVTPTTPPSNLFASDIQTASANIQWLQSPGNMPITYTLKRASTAGGPYADVVGCVNIGVVNCVDNSISPGMRYFYVAAATNSAGTSNNSAELSVITLTTAPTGLSFSSVTSSSLQLSWSASPGTASQITYSVFRSTSSGSNYQAVPTCIGISNTSCTDTGLSPGINYFYVVLASTASGSSPYSSEATTATLTTPPNSVTAVATTTSSVLLNWQNSPGSVPITYRVQRASVSGGPYAAISAGTCSNSALSVTTCIDSSALPGTQYFYVLQATTSGGTTNNSIEAQAITPTTVPTGLSATSIGYAQIDLAWTASLGSAGLITYKVFRSEISGVGYTAVTSASCAVMASGTTSCSDTSVQPGKKYFYVVNATTAGGVSAYSTEATATTTTLPPTNINASTISSTSISLSWSASPGAVPITYNVLRSTTSSGGYAAIPSGGCSGALSVTSCVDTNAAIGSTYYYIVTATTLGGVSANSSYATATTPTSPPTAVTATSLGTSSIELTWVASPGSAQINYTIFRSTTSGYGYTQVLTGGCGSAILNPIVTCVDTTVQPGTKYYYVITAATTGGVSVYSNEAEATTKTTPPATVQATATSSASVTVSWSASPGGASVSYSILRSTTGGGINFIPVSAGTCQSALVNTFTCTDTSVTAGNSYYYVVIATTAGGSSASSAEANAVTPSTPPTGVVATGLDTTSIGLTWNTSPGTAAVLYRVYRSTTASGPYAVVSGCNNLSLASCDESSLIPGTTYYYVVTSITAGGESAFSTEAQATTFTSPPNLNAATAVSSTAIALNWSTSPGTAAISYNVLRSTTAGGPYAAIPSGGCSASLSATTCTDTNATAGTTYYYVVTATTAGGVSSVSNERSITTIAAAPTGLAAVANGGGVVSLSWTASSGSAGSIFYTVRRSTSAGGPYTTVQTGIATTTYEDYSVTNGTTYYYVVQATTSGGSSANSNQISVTPISSFAIIGNITAPNQVTLTWNTATGASNYTVRQSTTMGGASTGTIVASCSSIATTICVINSGLTNGTTYYYSVSANNVGVGSSASNKTSEVPSTPFDTPFTTIVAGTGQVVINWSSIPNAINYNIYVSTVSGNAIAGGVLATGCSAISGNTCIATGLTNGTQYYFGLAAPLSTSGTFNSGEVNAIPIGAFDISAVTGLSATSAQVAWGNAIGATAYNVVYGTTAGSQTFSSGPFSGSPSTITNLNPGTTYYFKVVATNGQGSIHSNSEFSTTLMTTPPTNLAATASSGSAVNLSWNISPGTASISYNVLRSEVSGGPYTNVTCSVGISAGIASCTDSSASLGNRYFYVVRASTAGGVSANSSEAVVVTPTTVPTGLSGSAASSSSVLLFWTPSSGSDPISYTLKRSNTTGGPYSPVVGCVNVTSASCSDNSVSSGSNYFYVVSASNAAGSTGNSSELALTSQASPPTGLTATAVTASAINLSWTGGSGGASVSYRVSRALQTAGPYVAISTGGCSGTIAFPSTSCQDTSASPATKYFYVVQSVTLGGTSGNSNEASATTYASVPTALTAASTSTTSVALSWTGSSGSSTITYLAKRSLNGVTFSAILAGSCQSAGTATNCDDQDAQPGTTYYYVVTANTAAGASANSTVATTTTPTLPPTNLAATVTGTTSVNLSWTASPGSAEIRYQLYRATTSGGSYTAVSSCSAVTATSCTDTTASIGTQYFYVLTASTTGGVSSYSVEVTATTTSNPPTSLVATATGTTSVTLSWVASAGNAANITYTVKRSTSSGTGYASVISGTCSALVAGTSCTDENLTPGTRYYYIVIANTAGGSSANSSEASVTLPTTVPTNFAGSAVSTSSVNLTWTASPSSGAAVTYTLKRSSTSGTGHVAITSGTCSNSAISGTSCLDNSVTSGNIYYYIITATNSAGTTPAASEISVTVPANAPSNFIATSSSANAINLSWSLSSGNSAISYIVGRSTTPGGTYTNIASGGCAGNLTSGTNTCIDTGLSAGVTYYYTITAVNAGGNSALSSEASATTITTAPTSLTATPVSSTSVNLNWVASAGTASITYVVNRSLTSSSNYLPITTGGCSNVSTLSCVDTTAQPGYKYFYTVTAVNSGGNSVPSNEVVVNMPTSAPTGFSFTSISSASISMVWAPSPGTLANTYTVLRSATTGGPYANVVGCIAISSLNCTDSSVIPGTAYFYVVRATNANGTTGNSLEINTVTPATAPTGLTAIAGGSFVNFSWTASSGTASLISYSLKRSLISGASYSDVLTGVAATTASDNSVATGTTYYYVVNANTAGGVSTNSNQVTVTPIGTFSVNTITSSSGQIILNWNAASGASTYTVKSSTTFGGSASGTNVTGCVATVSLNCTVTGLTNGTTYYFTVVANNTGVNSSASNSTAEVSGTPLGTTLTVTALSSSQLSLSWASILNAVSYDIYFSTSSGNAVLGGQKAAGCNSVTTTNCTVTGLTSGTTYYFALVANLTPSGTFQSAEISATPIGAFDFTTLTATSGTTANISWSTAVGAINYLLEYGSSTGAYTGSQGPVTPTTIALTNLSPGNSYFMRIKAQNPGGFIYSTNERQLTLPTLPPSGLSLASLTINSVNLYWVVSPGNSSITYNILRSNTSGSGYVSLSGASGSCGAVVFTNACTDASVASGSTYYYVITATNSAGTTTNSNELVVTLPPSAPTSLTGTAINTSQIQINWAAVLGNAVGTTYTLSRSSTTGGAYAQVTGCTNISVLTCTDSSVSPGTTYYYIVTATNSGGVSANSTELAITSYTNPPATLSAVAANSTQVNLSWSASPGSASISYTILRAAAAGGPYNVLPSGGCAGNLTVLNCQDTTVTAGMKYFYIARANTSAGASINSLEVNVTTPTAAPTNVTAVAASSTLVNISWTASPGANIIYSIKRATVSGGPYTTPTSGTCSSGVNSPTVTCTDASAQPGMIYYYVLAATVGGSVSGDSAEASATMPTTAPVTLTAVAASATSVTLMWSASPGSSAITYTVYRSLNGTTFTAVPSGSGCNGNLTALTCTDTGLAIGTKYFYVVTASNSAGTSGNSVQSSATTFTTTPTNLTATATSTTTVSLSWTVSPGSAAITYNVLRSASSGSGFAQITCNVAVAASVASCIDSSPTAGNIYYYQVSATNAGGTTAATSEVAVTLPTNAPSTITATATNTTTVNLSWSASPGNSTISYIVLRSTTNLAGSFATFSTGTCTPAGVSGLNCTDTGGAPGNRYYYAVQAVNTAGTTALSVVANTVTQTTPPTGLTAVISGVGSISLSWTASPGNAPINYTVTRSVTSGSGYATLTSGTCANSSITGTTCSDLSNPVNGTTYYYVVTATNAFNTTANSNIASVSYGAPLNTVLPVLTGSGISSTSNIVTTTGNVLSTTLGTWSDTSNCSYGWYTNNSLISGATTANYSTQTSDLCRVITSCVTCSNILGTSKVCINGNSSTNGINTSGILSEYATRVSSISGFSLTTDGRNQIKSFLDNLITSNLALPDIVYAVQKQQNAGSGSVNNRTLFDLYCNTQNATIATSSYAWDQNGVLGSSALAPAPDYGIATSNSSLFTSTQPSTIVAYAQIPSSTNLNGIFGYSSNTSGSVTNGFGFNSGSGNNFRDDLSGQVITNNNVGYNFVGRSLSGTNNVINTNGTQTLPATNATALGAGKFILGNFPRSGSQVNYTLNGYLAFAAAWTNKALTFSEMETVRSAYTLNFPVPATVTYIGNRSGVVYTCTLTGGVVPNAGGCTSSSGFGSIYGVSSSSSFLYVVNDSGEVYSCQIVNNAIPATSSGCIKSTGFNDSYPRYPTIYYANNYVYVVMYSAGTVYSCPVQANGAITNSSGCSVASGFSNIYAGFVKNNYFYMANYSSVNKVTSCPLTSGVIVPNAGSCSQSSTFTRAWGMGYNGSYAYVGGYSNGNVYVCPFTSGVFPSSGSCTNSASGFGTIWAITSTPNSNNVYIINSSGVVYSCPIAANGSIPSAGGCSSNAGYGTSYGISIY